MNIIFQKSVPGANLAPNKPQVQNSKNPLTESLFIINRLTYYRFTVFVKVNASVWNIKEQKRQLEDPITTVVDDFISK